MNNDILVGVSWMYEPAFCRALFPLLEAGEIDAVEWSFDTVNDHRLLPDWMRDLLKTYSDAGRLYGHGLYYSAFSGKWQDRHTSWLSSLELLLQHYRFQHISEHFGFMTSGNAHEGAPLPVPFCPATLNLGVQRLKQLAHLVKVPVGIENLAFAFSPQDVEFQGDFLTQLITPIQGFILLDLHNIYCQSANFGVDAIELIKTYPLGRVKEIHVSGGSWEDSAYAKSPVRRDTHDHAIPNAVFSLLKDTLPLCPYVDLVIVERLGDTFLDERDEAMFRDDFLRVREIVRTAGISPVRKWPYQPDYSDKNFELAAENRYLQDQQSQILSILKDAPDAVVAHQLLLTNNGINQEIWQTKYWNLAMIDTAISLGRKWGIEVI